MVGKIFLFFAVLLLHPSYGFSAAPALSVESGRLPETAKLGQQIIFKMRVLDRLGISQIRGIPSDWTNVDVFFYEKKGENSVTRDGVVYDVRDLYFTVVVKTVGKMDFPPFCALASVPSLMTSRQLPPDVEFLPDYQALKICSPSFSTDIAPLPAAQPPLFPAERVEVFDGVFPKSLSVPAGQPVKRSIVLTAAGTLPVYLSAFKVPPVDGVKVYDGKTERIFDFKESTAYAALRQTIVFVPERSGTFVLPEMKTGWFDVTDGSVKEIVVPEITVAVTESVSASEKNQTTAVADVAPKKHDFPRFSVKTVFKTVLKVVVALLAAGFVFYFSIFPFLRRRRIKKLVEDAVVKACLSENPEKMEKAILLWAKTVYPFAGALSLGDVRRLFAGRDESFNAALCELEKRLYGIQQRFAKYLPSHKEKSGKQPFGERLAHLFLNLPVIRRQKTVKRDLPDLYPDD